MKNFDSFKTLTRTMQSFLAIVLVTLMAVGNVIGQTTYSHTITAKTWSELGTQSLNGVDWTASSTSTPATPYFGFNADKGQQFGSNGNPYADLTLTTNGISGTITSIKVNTSGNASVVATLKVKVGDTYFTSDGEESVNITATATDYTFTGSAEGAVSLEWEQPTTTLKALYLKSLEITYTSGDVVVAAPVLTPVGGTYYAAQNVTITCATEGANIYYSLDGTAPTTLYTGAIAVNETATIKAMAVKGADTSSITSITYTFPVELANIAAFKDQTSTSTIYKINSDLTVIFQTADKYHTFVQDESGAIYVYGTMDKAYNAGDVISGGLCGNYALYKQMNELKPVAGAPLADGVRGTEVQPIVVTLADLIANYATYEGKLVTVENVTVGADHAFQNGSTSGVNVSQDTNTIQIYSTFKNISKSLTANQMINVTGLVIRYNTTIEIAPRSNSDIVVPFVEVPYVLDFDTNTDDLVLENGNATNKWFVGEAQGFDNNKLFISSTNGTTNKYDISAASTAKATRGIIIPEKGAVLSFTSRVNGEEGQDMLNVYLYNYTNNNINTTPSWETTIVGENDWTEHTYSISPEYAGEASLVFEWVNNNNGGEQFPAAIDNIQFVEATCAQPIALKATVNEGNATIVWTPADSTQTEWTFEYKLEEHSEWYTLNATTDTLTLTDLQGSSVYNMRVKANCGEESSAWVEGQFSVGCLNETVVRVDTTMTIGTGTSTNSYVPFYYNYSFGYSQQIYTPSELNVTESGTIKSIKFNVSSGNPNNAGNIRIWLGHTNKESFSNATDYINPSNLDLVYAKEGAHTFGQGWNEFVFDTPFNYNGTDNLVVAYYEGYPNYGGSTTSFATHTASNKVLYQYSDGTGYSGGYTDPDHTYVNYEDPANSSTTSKSLSSNRNQLQLTINVAKMGCNDQLACEAPTNVKVKDITTEASTITWNGEADSYALEYKTGEEDWTAVTVDDTLYTLNGLTQKTTYIVRVKALCGENDYSLYTDEVEFTTMSLCPVVTEITSSNLSTTTTISWTPGGEENAWTVRFRPAGETEWIELPRISGIPSTTFGGLLDQTEYEVEIMALCDPNDEENQSSWAPYTFTSGCAAFELPYVEEFESAEVPNCWTSEEFTFNGAQAVATEAGQWLMTPPITIPASGNSYVVLDILQGSVSIQASYRGTALNRFEVIGNVADGEMRHVVFQVPDSYKDKAVNFMFQANGPVTIDMVEFTQCAFVPAELTAYDPTNTTVELSWIGENNNGWIVEYAEEGNEEWTSVNIDATSDTVHYTLAGLNGATTYNFRVRTVCAGGSASQPSEVATATTHCDPISAPYTHFSSNQDADFTCWNNYYSGTYAENGSFVASNNDLKMYNYYNRATDAADNTAFGNVYAVLPKFDTTLNVLQINFTTEQWTSNNTCKFQLGVVTDVNHPMETFRTLQEYSAGDNPASYTYILNNAIDGNLAFRLMKDSITQEVRIRNILVEFIPACQKPNSLVATPTSETTMDLTWNTIGIQRNWDIKYMQTQFDFNPESQGTLITANLRPRTISNLEYGQYYTFYIRNHCSSTEQSEWVGPFTYKLEMNYNIVNAADITTCHGNVIYQADTTGDNTLIVRPSSTGSWVTLSGNVQLGAASLKVYDGTEVNTNNLIATFTGSSVVNLTPACATELTLKLENVGTTAPVINLAINCDEVPTCSAPSKPEFDIETLTLTWEAGCWGTPESYNIQMMDATSGTTTDLTSTTNSLVVSNMPNDHTITFKVQPVCDGENGDWSEVSEEYVKFACGAPTAVTATYNEETQTATITWTPFMSTQRNFEVGYKLHNAFTWITATVNNATTYTTSALDELQTYDVRVKAICSDEESEYITTTVETPCVHEEQGVVMAQLGNGTSTNTYIPLARWYYNSYTQQLFTQEELAEQGVYSGMTIQTIGFNYYSSTATDVPLRLALANTDVTSLSSSFVSNNEFTEVFRSDWVHFDNTNNSWFTIQIDPFVYTGGNLVVSILKNYAERNTSHWTYGNGNYFYLNSQTGKTREYHNDNTADTYTITFNSEGRPYAGGSVQSGSSSSYRANLKFGAEGVICNPVVSCPAPSNIRLANNEITDHADIEWTAGGSEMSWTVAYTLNNGEEVVVTTTDNNFTITGLEASTSYTINFKVYANCDESHQSEGASETFNFRTPCHAFSIPYFEGFETDYTNNAIIGGCISQDGGSSSSDAWTSSNVTQTYSRGPRTGNGYGYLRYGNSRWMFIPVALEAGRNYEFSMFAKQDATSGCSMKVYYGTSATSSDMVNEVVASTNIGNSWIPLNGTITPTETRTYYVGIYATLSYAPWYVNIDDISIVLGLACAKPADLAFNGSTNTLTWTGDADSYTLKYREVGTEAYTTVTSNTTTYTFSDLDFSTTYEVAVQADCGAIDGVSEWRTTTFTTPECANPCIYYVDMHDSYGDGWNGNAIEVYKNGVLSQSLTISAGNRENLEMVEVCDGAEFRWIRGSYPNETSFEIYGPDGNLVYSCNSGSNLTNGEVLYNAPSCVPITCSVPTNFNLDVNGSDYTISWSAGTAGTPESYVFQYRVSGTEEFTQVTLTDTFYTFVNAVPATVYEFQVQANCGVDDGQSSWSSVMSFVIPANCDEAFNMPFVETFETNSASLSCWILDDADRDGFNWGIGEEGFNVHGGDRCAISASYDNDSEDALYPDNWLISPAINIVDNAQLRYWMRGQDPDWAEEHYSVYVATTNTVAGFLATTPVDSGETTDEYVETIVDLSSYAGQTVYIAFRHHNSTNMYYLNLDDISVIVDPCVGQTITEETPYTEGFEEYTGSNEIELDNCWYSDGAGYTAGNGVHAPFVYGNYAYAAHTGSYSLEMKGNQGMVVLPKFTNDINTLSLTFWANRVSSSATDEVIIGVITDIDDPTTFVPVETLTTVGSRGNSTFVGPIEFNNVPATGRIALRYTSNSSTQSWNLDDFTVFLTPTCFVPVSLTVSDVDENSAKISWSDPRHQGNYAVEYKEENATTWTTVMGDTTNNVVLTGLNEVTTYVVRMKAVCGADDESVYTDEVVFTTIAVPATLPYVFSFNDNTENSRWQLVNGSQTNKWAIGSATGNGDNNALYVSNDGGESNAYTISATSDVWAYRDIDVDSAYMYRLTFDWKGNGESNGSYHYDYMQVYVGERGDVTPGSAAIANAIRLGEQYMDGQQEWTTFTTDLDNTFAGRKRLYFYWRNDSSSGAQTPAAVDNISIMALDKDLKIVSVEPINDNCDLSNAEVTIKVENHSYSDVINGFTAMYVLNGTDTVSETVNATIASHGTYTHTFATTPAFVDGSNDLEVSVVYDEDMNLTNNSLALTDIRQVVPASVPYEQDFSNVVLGRDAWTQGTENENPNLWTNNNGVMTFMGSDTMASQNYFITHCIEIPAGQVQVAYDYNALSSLSENMNVYMGTTPDITTMTLIGSHTDFAKADEDYTYNYLFDNDNAGVYYFAVEATSQAGNMGITFDNLTVMPMIDVTVTAGPNGTVSPLGLVKVPYNGDLTINIIPDNMYHVAGVWVDGERVMNEDQFNASFMMYTLNNIDTAHTINVEFKQEFHIFKYVYNYNDQYAEVGGQIVGQPIDTTTNTSNVSVQFTADEHYTLHSLIVGITPPASEGALIDGTNMIADVVYDSVANVYTYTFDTLYVSNYYVQACFKMDTVNIHYRVLTGEGVFDGVNVAVGESHDTWVDYGTDHTSTIQPADGYYTMAVTVNALNAGIIDHYDFDSIITTQYVTAQFGHMVTASISNYNGINYLGSDEVRGTIEPDTQMVLSGSSCSVSGTVQEHFHLQSFLVNGVDMLDQVLVDGNNFTFTIDSLVANTNIEAEVQIDQMAIYYTVANGNGIVNGNEMNAVAHDTLYIDYMSSFLSTFEAAEGYHIVNVVVNGVSYDEIPQWLTEFITSPQDIVITFALNEYDITTTIYGNGAVSPGAHVVYDLNSSYVFTATPDEGYHISQILRNNVSLPIENPEGTYTETIAPVLNNYDYLVYVMPNIYTVTASAGENGSIDPYGVQSYEYGSTPTFTIIPDAGYEIDEVLVDGEVVTLTDGAYTFEALTENHTISATFTRIDFTITATAGANGTITPSGEITVAHGSMQTFEIAPATGYEIADVTVDGVSVGAVSSYVFESVVADHTINATFSKINLTIVASAGANGTITPSGNVTVEYGNVQAFTIAASDGYEVDYVTVDGMEVYLTNNTYTFTNVTTNHTIFVAFKPATYTITVTDPVNGTITPNGVITVGYHATPTFTVMPTIGYTVKNIKVDNVDVLANAVATVMDGYTYTFPAVEANHTLTAEMEIKKFNIVATAGANGSITPSGTAQVNYGANSATYAMTPADGYMIDKVLVDGINMGAISSYTFFNVTANHQISVTFKAEPCVKPSNLQVINIDSTSATLTWYHPGADSYDIQYKTVDAATWTLVQNVPGFAYNLTNLQSNTTYLCKIKANTAGCTDTDWSNAITFKTNAGPSSPDGLADYVKNHVNVYAEHNRVHIVNDYSVDINNVAIYDMYGKVVYSGNAINNPEVIELNVAIGTYVVRLTTAQGPAVYKVHINR